MKKQNIGGIVDKPLSGNDIISVVQKNGGDTGLIKYGQLKKVGDIMNVLKNDCCVILYETKKNFGHWCCLIETNFGNEKVLEFFDPYGMIMDDELKYSSYSGKNPRLLQLLYDCDLPISYNHHKFQKMKDGVSTCGAWCALRIINKGLSLEQFNNKYGKIGDNGVAQLIHQQL